MSKIDWCDVHVEHDGGMWEDFRRFVRICWAIRTVPRLAGIGVNGMRVLLRTKLDGKNSFTGDININKGNYYESNRIWKYITKPVTPIPEI